MSTDKKAPKELKVTDKRIFTAEGELKEEFKNDIQAAAPEAAAAPEIAAAPEPVAAAPEPQQQAAPSAASQPSEARPEARPEERRQRPAPAAQPRQRDDAERGANPETPFAHFLESLIMQAYMSLGMLRNPYSPQAKADPAAARQMIDILNMLKEKTAGNLAPEEEEFLDAHLGELKLAYVQRTKNI